MKIRTVFALAGLLALCAAISILPAQQTPIAYDQLGHALYAGPDCNSKVSPAVCTSAGTGSVVVAAAATTVVVNTTAAGPGTHIFVQEDSSLGTLLGVTCNTTPATAPPTISARVTGVSFTITTTAPTTNPRCFSYYIFN